MDDAQRLIASWLSPAARILYARLLLQRAPQPAALSRDDARDDLRIAGVDISQGAW